MGMENNVRTELDNITASLKTDLDTFTRAHVAKLDTLFSASRLPALPSIPEVPPLIMPWNR